MEGNLVFNVAGWSILTGLPVTLYTYIFIYLQAFGNSSYYVSSVMYTHLGAQPDSVLVVKFSSKQHSIQLMEELFVTFNFQQ